MGRRSDGRGLILLYHRVAALEFDPQLLCVTPERFAEHLEVLRRVAVPVPLSRIRLSRIRQASALERPHSVAVTFDDGYADNLLAAAPLLEAAEVPATVFVVSGMVGATREFWWDELERVLLGPAPLPPVLRIQVAGRGLEWDLHEAAEPCDGDVRRHSRWTVLERHDPTARHTAYRYLCGALRRLGDKERLRVLDQLADLAGIDIAARDTHRALTADELRELVRHGLVAPGAHTMTHPSLASRPRVEQLAEIAGSKRCLEDIVGTSVTMFSYPFGTSADFTRATVALVRKAGFELACANIPGRLGLRPRRLRVPRFIVRDWDGQEFERHLDAWLRD